MLSRICITEREAFESWIKITYVPGETIWLKQGSTRFYRGLVGNDYLVSGWETRGSRDDRRFFQYFPDLFAELERGALAGEEQGYGVYFIAGKPTEAPLKEYCQGSNIISFELDDGTDDEQWEIISTVANNSGIIPNYLLTSGGKSNHGGYVLDVVVDSAKNEFYRKLACIVHLSDPAVVGQQQPMRAPGFYRANKDKYQVLRHLHGDKPNSEEFEQAMKRCFAVLDFTWWSFEEFSQERWRQVRKVLVSKLTRSDKQSQIREILSQPEFIINPNPPRQLQPVNDFQYNGEAIPLEFFLSRDNQQLLRAGQGEGDRDNSAYRIAKDLIGAADALQRLGIRSDGDPRQLFDDFTARCSPPLLSRDCERIWRSASRGIPKAALPDEGILARASYWQSQHHQEYAFRDSKDVEYYTKRAQEQEEWEKTTDYELADQKVQWLARYPQRVKWTQQRLKSLDPWNPITQNTQFVELLVKDFLPKDHQPSIFSHEEAQTSKESLNQSQSFTDLPPGLYGIAAGMGTGKTTLMLQIIKQFKEGNLISFRNSLLVQTCYHPLVKDIIFFLWDLERGSDNPREEKQRWIKAKQGWMAACVESIAKCRPKDVLILEEVEKIKKSLLESATCRRDRRARLKEFERHLQTAKHIFCCDADLTGSTLKWLQSLIPDKKINVLKNVMQRFQWNCYIFTGAKEIFSDAEVKEFPNKRDNYELSLLSQLAAGKKLIVAADSQRWGEAIERAFKAINPNAKGLRIDSITKADEATKDMVEEFLQNPNKWIKKHKPDYIIYTPTCEASLDITVENYFDSVWGYFVHLTHYSCKQMLGRLRTNAPRYIFAKTHVIDDDGASKSPLPQVVAKHMFTHNFETIREIMLTEHPEIKDDFQLIKKLNEIIDFDSGEYKDPHIQALVEMRAQDNYSRANLRQQLAQELEASGHIVIWCEASSPAKCPTTPFRKEIIKEWAKAIATADDIDIEEAWTIQSSMNANLADRHKATKAILKDRLPEFNLTAEFIADYYLDDTHWISRQEMRYLLDNPETAKALDRERWVSALKYDTAWWDVRTNSLAIKALNVMNIPEIARSGHEWHKDSEWLIEFKERAIANSQLLQLGLGLTAKPNSDPCYLLRRCLEKAGYSILRHQRRVKGSGERIRLYRVDESINEEGSICSEVYKAIHKRYSQKLQKLAVSRGSYTKFFASPVFVNSLLESGTRCLRAGKKLGDNASQTAQIDDSLNYAVCDVLEPDLLDLLGISFQVKLFDATKNILPLSELPFSQQQTISANLQLVDECENWEMFECLLQVWSQEFRV